MPVSKSSKKNISNNGISLFKKGAHGAQPRNNKKRKMMEDAIRESYATEKFTLSNGKMMPKIGLGTYKIKEVHTIEQAVDIALGVGYRLFDTAAVYNNEVALGEAIRKGMEKYSISRNDIFITTKLAPCDLGDYEVVSAAYERSIENLGSSPDLYLIHFPGSTKMSNRNVRNREMRHKAWAALTRLYEEGQVESIGVANFTVKHLEALGIQADGVMPMVNQVEWHPNYYQEDLLEYCRAHDICLQAYGSMGGASSGDPSLLNDPVVKRIAEDHVASPAQVLLAWALQQDAAVIPKSVHPHRIKDNIEVTFVLTEREIKALNALRVDEGRKYAWDPTEVY